MKKGMNNTTLGSYVKARRLARGLDVRSCSERSGLNDSYWRKLEAGHYESPEPFTLRQVARALRCPLEDLYSLCGYTVHRVLPTFGPYLRATTNLSPGDIAVMERIFASLSNKSANEAGDDRRAA